MIFAVAQLGDFKGDFLLFLFGFFFNCSQLFAQLFIEDNPFDDRIGRLGFL